MKFYERNNSDAWDISRLQTHSKSREDEKRMGREELKRPKEISIAIKPWICCFLKRNNACILTLFCVLLNIIGFGYSSNHCNLKLIGQTKKIFMYNYWYRIWIGIDLLHFELWKYSCSGIICVLNWRLRRTWTLNIFLRGEEQILTISGDFLINL